MRVAAQTYTIRNFCKNEQDIFESLKKIKSIGFDAFQLSSFGPFDPKRLRDFIDSIELEVFVTHMPLNRILEDSENVAKEHKILGADYVGLGYFKSNKFEDYKDLVGKLAKSVKVFEDYGLKFVYHNHHHEFYKAENTTYLDYILDSLPSAGLLADLYWVQYAGYSPEFILDKYKNRIDIVHLKDMTLNSEFNPTFAEVFEGNMDYKNIIGKCKENGVKWAAIEQDDNWRGGDPFASLKTSLSNINKNNY